MNYYGNRYSETYSYVRVSPIDWSEKEEYEYIIDGSLEISTENNLKVTGSFSFKGPEVLSQNEMIRVYYSFYDEDEELFRQPLATLYITYSDINYTDIIDGMLYSGTINASSVLVPLQDKKYGQPFVVKRNENAIYKAQQLITEFGLRVDFTPSSKVLTSDYVFPATSDYLEVVNWLCDYAEYRPVYPNEEGVIQIHPKTKPEDTPDIFTFINDDNSIMYPEVSNNNTWLESANVVKLIYTTDNTSAIGTARNLSGSKSSLEALNGREKTLVEEISEVEGKGALKERLANQAEKKLKDQAEEVEYVSFSHAYIPRYIYEDIKVIYSDLSWVGSIENMSISLAPSTKTQTRLKRAITQNIEIEKYCTVYREPSTNS